MRFMAHTFDVCIRGAGIVGRTLALLLARERLRVALVANPSPAGTEPDVRAYALNTASRSLLESLRVWPDPVHATPIRHMEVFGDVDGSVHFDAGVHEVDALGWITDVAALETRLTEAVRYQPMVEVVNQPVDAPLTAICEGRASQTRAELGVEFDITPYPQHALATRLRCELPHAQVARQWFSADGILAFLPMEGESGQTVAVVWSTTPENAQQWKTAEPAAFTAHLQQLSQNALGALELAGPRMSWPLQQAVAARWCGPMPATVGHATPAGQERSWVLAGDAAHTVHPLAGQGLNLGLADVQALGRLLQEREWRSTGDLKLLRKYERERKAGIATMGLAMDGLQQLFSRSEAPLQALRNWGMKGFERSGPLKDWMARQAMGL